MLKDSGVEALCEGLLHSHITHLTLRVNGITELGALALARALYAGASLKELM